MDLDLTLFYYVINTISLLPEFFPPGFVREFMFNRAELQYRAFPEGATK